MRLGNAEKHSLPSPAYIQLHPQQKGRQKGNAGTSTIKRFALLLVTLAVLLFTGWQLYSYAQSTFSHPVVDQHSQPGIATDVSPPFAGSQEQPVFRQHAKPASFYHRPNYEAGIVFPQWSTDGYGASWQRQLPAIQDQTGARWIEITFFLDQATDNSTQVRTNKSTPTVRSFAAGVAAARAAGYRVFIVPLMGVDSPAEQWAGTIQFSNYQDEAQWFDSYWRTLQPYAAAAAQAGAEQMAIGTELVELQRSAPAALWNALISRIHSVFPGALTYDMNWSSLSQPLASWLSNPQLAMIGVSEYLPLVNERIRVEPKQIKGLWKTRIKSALDSTSIKLGKPIVISEIGYRNSADTLYNTWLPYSTVSPPDPAEQAAACDAALANVVPDPHIVGTFFWGWDNVQGFKLSGQPAAGVLNRWYSSPLS